MTTQPEALRLADLLEAPSRGTFERHTATELRRLHAENEQLKACVEQLEAAEEGAKEAFGHIVDQKRDAEAGLVQCRLTIGSQQAVIHKFRRALQIARDALQVAYLGRSHEAYKAALAKIDGAAP